MIQFLLLPCDDNLNWSSVPGLTLVANISHPKLYIYIILVVIQATLFQEWNLQQSLKMK